MARVLFHIDLNAFFASAEELRHPEYKDKPLAVGSLSARGVLSTCNYAAREAGIHSAMPTMQAKALCEDLVIIPGDYDYYRKLSGQFFDYLRKYCGKMEILSIDECFLDVTEVIKNFERPLDLAVTIQQGLLKTLGLKCSIGVGPTRFLAKMASDLHKPMGISVLRKSDIPKKLYPLDVEDCIGIGKKTVPKLKEQGIETIGDLADPDNEQTVKQILGNSWLEIKMKITGASSDQLIYSTTRKSFSHSRTFRSDIYTEEELLEEARGLTMELCQSMNRARKKGMIVSVVLRNTEFENEVRSARLPGMSSQFEVIYEAVRNLIDANFEPVGYRHLGVSVGSLQDEEQIVLQPTLFDMPGNATEAVIDTFNASLDNPLLMKASDLLKKKESS